MLRRRAPRLQQGAPAVAPAHGKRDPQWQAWACNGSGENAAGSGRGHHPVGASVSARPPPENLPSIGGGRPHEGTRGLAAAVRSQRGCARLAAGIGSKAAAQDPPFHSHLLSRPTLCRLGPSAMIREERARPLPWRRDNRGRYCALAGTKGALWQDARPSGWRWWRAGAVETKRGEGRRIVPKESRPCQGRAV